MILDDAEALVRAAAVAAGVPGEAVTPPLDMAEAMRPAPRLELEWLKERWVPLARRLKRVPAEPVAHPTGEAGEPGETGETGETGEEGEAGGLAQVEISPERYCRTIHQEYAVELLARCQVCPPRDAAEPDAWLAAFLERFRGAMPRLTRDSAGNPLRALVQEVAYPGQRRRLVAVTAPERLTLHLGFGGVVARAEDVPWILDAHLTPYFRR